MRAKDAWKTEATRNPDGSAPDICPECEVDHQWTWADLSHGIIRLMIHAMELVDWHEFPINGDMIARQRAGILGPALLYSTADPEEINWDYVNSQRTT